VDEERQRREAARELGERSVELHVPDWVWADDPAELAQVCQWTTADLPDGGWSVQLTERVCPSAL